MTDQAVTKMELPPLAPQSESAAVISMIERLASDATVDISRIEKLIELRERMEARAARVAYNVAFAKLQPELPSIERNGTIVVYSKMHRDFAAKNEGEYPAGARPIQSTKYALWQDVADGIRGPLAAHGFALSFRTGLAQDGKVTVTGVLAHEAGHQEETTITLMHDSSGSKNNVQAVGSSITYGKRYTAGLLLNLTSRDGLENDDDGKAAGATATADAITEEQLAALEKLVVSTGANRERFLKALKLADLALLPAKRFDEAREMLFTVERRRMGKEAQQ